MATVEESTVRGCPFSCGKAFSGNDWYQLALLHIEEEHTEGSPFVVREDGEGYAEHSRPSTTNSKEVDNESTDSEEEKDEYVLCPEEGCGEMVLLIEYTDHLDLHQAENAILDDSVSCNSTTTTLTCSPGKDESSLVGRSPDKSTSAIPPHCLDPSSGSVGTRLSSAQSPVMNFSTTISPALRATSSKSKPNTSHRNRHRRSRPLTKFANRTASKPTSYTKRDTDGLGQKDRIKRLGKKELGPYAYEDRMPKWLYDQMKSEPRVFRYNIIGRDGRLVAIERIENEVASVVPMLARLSELDPSVEEAWFCHPSVRHISKYPNEGGFCGYRNIQMAISFLQGSKSLGHQIFSNKVPTVIQLQEWIEDAWDRGINDFAREQFGKLKGTRKWIGTTEACTLFEHFGIPFDGFNGYDEKRDDHDRPARMAHEVLLDKIEDYFYDNDDDEEEEEAKIHRTCKPPLFLQHDVHSLTVVGIEWRTDGTSNLLVFDPLFRTPDGMFRLLEKRLSPSTMSSRHVYDVMRIYRRKSKYLAKYDSFETCFLAVEPPPLSVLDE